MRQLVRLSLGLLLVVVVGCGTRSRSGVVSGKVTYKGQPVNDAALLLYAPGAKAPITIPVTAQGEFSIADTPPGEYKVVVEGAKGGAVSVDLRVLPRDKQAELKEKMKAMSSPTTIPFPKKYKDLRTTDLKCTITDKNQKLDIELQD
jgi:hypothetical protein